MQPLSGMRFLCRRPFRNDTAKRHPGRPEPAQETDPDTPDLRPDLERGILSKQDAYRWMADKFCLNPKDAHIGNFSDYMCDQLIQEASKVLHNNQKQFSPAGCRREAA